MTKTAIVTGAAGGLGFVTAKAFAARGYQVVALDLTDLPDAAASSQIAFHRCDLGDGAALCALVTEISRSLGRVDVLVNNVGIAGPSGPVEAVALAEWQQTFQVNLDSAFVTCNALLPAMKAAGQGAIINISTSSVKASLPSRAAYVASKAALEALTCVIAREAGPCGVRANIVRPGAMDNDRLNRVIADVAGRESKSVATVEKELLRYISMRTKVSMAEVAEMVLYLASDDARHVTGQVIAVDGGVEWEY